MLNQYCGIEGCLAKPNKEGWCREHRARGPSRRYSSIIKAAKKRKIPCTLTRAQFDQLMRPGVCTYCQGPLPAAGGGLDRINNRKGYTLKNCTPCCTPCNRLKSDLLSFEETKIVVDILRKVRKLEYVWSKARNSHNRRR